ncbi:MAG: flagellar biosynthetic protein FliO [Opitutae bacterium]|nr:flagellar biosynthetic protein FliO [Opitutae bacterium]
MTRFVAGFALVLTLVAPPVLRAEEKVIYPRNTDATPADAAPVGKPGSGLNPLLLVLALGAAGAGGWLLWRQRTAPAGATGREARKLAIAESRSLGNRQYLVVADYDGKKFLLGVCPGRIDLLSPLEGEKK